MKFIKLFLPSTALLLSIFASNVAMARPVKTVFIYNSQSAAHNKYVLPAQGVGHAHRVKRKQPVYVIYAPVKLKQRHFKKLSSFQRVRFENAFLSAVTVSNGSPVYWNVNGSSGSVIVYKEASLGEGCRSYIQTVTINGKQEKLRGIACRQSNNSWKIIS
ncbi:hypothetical protein [Kiloniella sp.]|uniref:hypothetical protein n=1 Tax=Kiloniella sp. TaxID=1938587 RepID=UPI003B014218